MSEPPVQSVSNNPAVRWIAAIVALICISMIAVAATRMGAENASSVEVMEGPHLACYEQESRCFSFIAMGDSGSGNSNQMAVAEQMLAEYTKRPFTHVLMLGDNIYDHGDVARYGEARFTKPYKPLLDAGVKFVTVLGNHDVLFGHRDAQIKFFNMPGAYYSVTAGTLLEKVTDNPEAEFFAIDSNTFYKDEIQRRWLEKALAESKANWKIVVGHHPPFTSGAHAGEGDLVKLRNTLVPILIQGNAHLYLAGHDHNYERFKPMADVWYFVSGGGGAWLRDFKANPAAGSALRVKRYHFMRFDSDGKHLHFQAIDKDGNVFDQGQINKPEEQVPVRDAA